MPILTLTHREHGAIIAQRITADLTQSEAADRAARAEEDFLEAFPLAVIPLAQRTEGRLLRRFQAHEAHLSIQIDY